MSDVLTFRIQFIDHKISVVLSARSKYHQLMILTQSS